MTETDELTTQQGCVDPWELLKNLSSLLGAQGNIKGMEEIEEIARLMAEEMSEGKMVTSCTYLNTLQATTDLVILSRFVEVGGWSALHDYLEQARDRDNTPLLIEILAVYNVLPVTVDLLKQNTAAKTIKQLGKSCPNPDVKKKALAIVDHWMKTVRGNADKQKKHQKDSKKSTSNSLENGTSKSSEKHQRHKDSNQRSPDKKPHSHRLSSVDSNGSSPSRSESPTDSNSSSSSVRPKTVKTVPTKFRSSGLLEVDDTVPGQKTKIEKSLKRPSQNKPPTLEKKSRPNVDTSITSSSSSSNKESSPTEEKTHGKIKLIPARPRPPPVKEVYESTGFMDALTPHTVAPLRIRKRKMSSAKETDRRPASSSQSNSVGEHDTAAEEAVSDAVPSSSPVEPKPTLPSFYKETLNTSDRDDGDSSGRGEGGEGNENGAEDSAADSSSVAPSDDKDDDSKSVQSTESYEPPKKKRKKVSWAEDNDLRAFYFFELDETERVNVNRQNGNFADIQKKELMREKEMFQEARRFHNPPHSGDVMAEAMAWRPLRRITIQGETIERGFNSTEKEGQKKREDGVLFALYFSKHMIPESAAEPDAEVVSPHEPKIMPLEDETGQSGEVVYTDYPKPVTEKPSEAKSSKPQQNPPQLSLPQDVADLLASMAQQGQMYLNSTSQGQTFQMPQGQSSQFQGQPLPFQGQPPQFQGQGQHFQGQPPPFAGNTPPQAPPKLDMSELQDLINSLMTGQIALDSLSDNVKVQIQEMLTLQAQGAVPPPQSSSQSPQQQQQQQPQSGEWTGSGRPPLLPKPTQYDMNMPPPGFPPNRPMMGGPIGGPMQGPPPPFRGGPTGMMRGRGPPMRPNGPMRGHPATRGENPPVCRHFLVGTCRFGPTCRKLHPGVNGPHLPGRQGGPGRGGMSPPSHVSPQHA